MNEKAFLSSYDKSAYSAPLLTVDAVLFTYHDNHLKVLLVRRSVYPDRNKWALPGGFIDEGLDKTLEDTVNRKLKEKTGVDAPYIEQLASFGNVSRDKRGWSATIVFTAMVAHQVCSSHLQGVADVEWVEINSIGKLKMAFDHAEIIKIALERIRQKALYSIVPAFALPEKFTLPQLQQVHEVLLGITLQKKSFRRRILQANLIEDTGDKQSLGGRPAILYKLKTGVDKFTFLRNLEA